MDIKSFTQSFFAVSIINILIYIFFDIPIALYLIPVTICGWATLYKILELFQLAKLTQANPPLVFYFYITVFIATYLAPLAHFASNFWIIFNNSLILPKNWEPYVFTIAVINAIGILVFINCYNYFYYLESKNKTVFLLSQDSNINYIYLFGCISFIFQLYIYIQLGGLSGFIATYEARGEEQGFGGFGLLFMISEFLPTALILLFYIKVQSSPSLKNRNTIFIFLLILFISCIFFGGLRGSRSNTILTIIHAVMVIHFYIRKFAYKELAVAGIFLLSFMFVYKFYKQGGVEAVKQFSEGTIDKSTDKYDFNLLEMMLTDFARADIQPYLIYRFDNFKYQPKFGATYIGGILHYLPSFAIDRNNLTTKKTAATELLYQQKGENIGYFTTRIFGLVGEYILNFGYATAFLVFIPLAFFLARLDKWIKQLQPNDIRNFIVPLWILFVIFLFNADFDNAIFFFMKRMFLAMLLVFLISKRYRLQENILP